MAAFNCRPTVLVAHFLNQTFNVSPFFLLSSERLFRDFGTLHD